MCVPASPAEERERQNAGSAETTPPASARCRHSAPANTPPVQHPVRVGNVMRQHLVYRASPAQFGQVRQHFLRQTGRGSDRQRRLLARGRFSGTCCAPRATACLSPRPLGGGAQGVEQQTRQVPHLSALLQFCAPGMDELRCEVRERRHGLHRGWLWVDAPGPQGDEIRRDTGRLLLRRGKVLLC